MVLAGWLVGGIRKASQCFWFLVNILYILILPKSHRNVCGMQEHCCWPWHGSSPLKLQIFWAVLQWRCWDIRSTLKLLENIKNGKKYVCYYFFYFYCCLLMELLEGNIWLLRQGKARFAGYSALFPGRDVFYCHFRRAQHTEICLLIESHLFLCSLCVKCLDTTSCAESAFDKC